MKNKAMKADSKTMGEETREEVGERLKRRQLN